MLAALGTEYTTIKRSDWNHGSETQYNISIFMNQKRCLDIIERMICIKIYEMQNRSRRSDTLSMKISNQAKFVKSQSGTLRETANCQVQSLRCGAKRKRDRTLDCLKNASPDQRPCSWNLYPDRSRAPRGYAVAETITYTHGQSGSAAVCLWTMNRFRYRYPKKDCTGQEELPGAALK